MKRFLSLLLIFVLLLLIILPVHATYSDVPADHWAAEDIALAQAHGLMQGYGNGVFGLGDTLSRAAFLTMLERMMGWPTATVDAPSFSDCPTDTWYFSTVETALAMDVIDLTTTFRPTAPITRREMAVMLVRSLGYTNLVDTAAAQPSPFADGHEDGYLTLAYDLGMSKGVEQADGTLLFSPNDSATREQAAAMLVRVYQRYSADLDWLHGFYAFSSYSQIDMTAEMDAFTVGWARMAVTAEGTPWINSTTAENNEWTIPKDSTTALNYFKDTAVPYNLNVYASVWDSVTLADDTSTNAVSAILATEESRSTAIDAIVAVAPDYAGITIDFEGMREDLKAPFLTFMTDLRAALPTDKTLYVCVQPDTWFTGFDYRGLGELCDKVILMAHDYRWPTIPDYYVGTTNTHCPVTPFQSIYTDLRTITDPDTGVRDTSKIALAISFGSTGFWIDDDGRIQSTTFYTPTPSTLYTRMNQEDTTYTYSEYNRNPYLTYTTESGKRYKVWYEDSQSVLDKIALARMFGINGVSLWRLGTVPNYEDEELHYNVWGDILSQRPQ